MADHILCRFIWTLLISCVLVGTGCNSLREDDGSAGSLSDLNAVSKGKAIQWLQQKTPIRQADNHHLTMDLDSEPTCEEWLEEGRRIERIASSLTALLRHKDPEVDLPQVAYALGWLGDATGVPVLIDALDSEDVYLRIEAAAALGRLADKRAIPVLCKTAVKDENHNARANAVAALGSFEGPEVRACLESALKDESQFVRELARESLIHPKE